MLAGPWLMGAEARFVSKELPSKIPLFFLSPLGQTILISLADDFSAADEALELIELLHLRGGMF